MTGDKVLEMLAREVAKAGGVTEYARKHGLDQGNVSRTLSGNRQAGPQLLGLLGLERVVSYRKRLV